MFYVCVLTQGKQAKKWANHHRERFTAKTAFTFCFPLLFWKNDTGNREIWQTLNMNVLFMTFIFISIHILYDVVEKYQIFV